MADDRPAEDPTEALGRMQRELDDLRSTVLVRVDRRPTGTIEAVFRTTPAPDTLFLQGQVVNRADYPVLWQFVTDQSLVVAGGFTAGNGSTTFGLPDARNRALVGAGGTYVLGALVGAATKTLVTANLPSHDHSVAVAAHATHNHVVTVGSHFHSATTSTDNGHGGHFPGTLVYVPNGTDDFGVAAWNSGGVGSGPHSHSFSTNSVAPTATESLAGPTTHAVTETPVGSGTPLNVEQPSWAVNIAVWT